MATTIKIIPPQGMEQEIRVWEKCTVRMSATSKVGSFSLVIPDNDGALVDAFPVGSDVSIVQNGHIFRGWIMNPAKRLDGRVKWISIEGICYTGRTQKIVVTEAYTNEKISDIVTDLFAKYMPWVDRVGIIECDKMVSIKFNDEFLFDCMEQLANLAGYEWSIYEPLPQDIEMPGESSGWTEFVEIVPPLTVEETAAWAEEIQLIVYPALLPRETLYPREDLYPS
jgi:hypothetical protein